MPILIAAVMIGSAIYGAVESESARKEAKKTAREQQAEAARLQKEFESRQMNDAKSTAGKDAKARQQQLASAASGRSDTILTGPSGLTDPNSGAKKTLLGM